MQVVKRLIRGTQVVIASRHLFKNWIRAAIGYELTRRGLVKRRVIVKCGGNEYMLSLELYSFIVNKYFDGFVTNFKCDEELELSLSGAIKLVVDRNGNAFFIMPDSVKIYANIFDMLIISETWLYDTHFLGFDLRDWLVVDVEAYIGDTALYYARRGAFVIAVEPVPKHFDAMVRNIELNPELKQRILPINAAIAGRDGYVDMAINGEFDGGASIYKWSSKKVRVKAYMLKSLMSHVEELGVDINAFKIRALKMDCKGCEWDVVNSESETLKIFDVLKIEYSGYLRGYTADQLINKLESLGFKCRVYAHNEFAVKMGLHRHGTVMCVRV